MARDRGIFHPDYRAEPFWWQAARPGTRHSVEPPENCEILVVGSGYAGLSAALELARGGRNVCVVEALAFGEGASTRNGGGVSAGVNLGKGLSGGPGQGSQPEARRNFVASALHESVAAYEHLKALIAREGIDCKFEERGRFIGAYAPQHYDGLVAKARELNDAVGLDAAPVPRAQQHDEIASDFYHGGITVGRAGKLQPALYHAGLLAACHRAGVKMSAHAPVSRIDGGRGGLAVHTGKGIVRAEEVVIATNGYTGALTPKLRRRLVPVSSQIIVTEELPDELATSLVPRGRTISETPRILCYYRLTPDNRRVMFGGRARFHPVHPDTSAALLHQMMLRRWPQLAGVRISYSWSGFVAMTTDALPHMGLEDGLHYCAGCNGSGVAMLTWLGHQVARRILQHDQSTSVFADLPFPDVPVPFYDGHPWFLPLVGNYYRLRDRLDRGRD